MRTTSIVLTVLGSAMLLAGCGGDEAKKASSREDNAPVEQVASVLVLDGQSVGKDGARAADAAKAAGPATASTARRVRVAAKLRPEEEWPEPELFSDGTINDGPDPFAGEIIQSQPIPIEDDPATTKQIDAVSARLRRVDRVQWDKWIAAGIKEPLGQGSNPSTVGLVRILVERCGGARTVATGVVLDDETVATTVHVIESASKRVRVSSAFGDGERLPAMIRYLDVDDDIAILKVPGMKLRQMPFHVVTGTTAQWGYAYGMGRGGTAGTLRRAPVIVAMQESSIKLEQPDGLAQQISDRSIYPVVGGIDTGFSGGVVSASNDPTLVTGWGFHGLVRARVPYRADTAGIVVPSRLVVDALNASDRLDEWYEHAPGGCPQWRR